MFKKITANILTIMLMAGTFLGVIGASIPESVHADPQRFPLSHLIL